MDKKQFSYAKQLEIFINFINQAIKDYEYCYEKVNVKDKEKCDLEHELEIGNLSYGDTCKLATQLKRVLKERRESKDVVEKVVALHDYFSDNPKLINELSQLLGKLRKVETIHNTRQYKARVRNDLTICKK